MKRARVGVGGVVLGLGLAGLGCAVLGDSGNYKDIDGAGAGSSTTTATEPPAPTPPKSRSGGSNDDIPQPAGTEADVVSKCVGDRPSIAFYMSADDSNSMASPALAREWLNAGLAPQTKHLRTYEFLNYYNALYPAPSAAEAQLEAHLELESLSESGTEAAPRYRLQIGVQAFEVPRERLVVTFVIDTSGSLVGAGIARAREALNAMSDKLLAGDVVSVVTWANDENVLLEGYVANGESDASALAVAVANLVPGGGSDLHSGLLRGYELAGKHFDATALNRVVLVSDGGANLGVLDRNIIADAAKEANDEGIYLVGIGVGPAGGYSDNLMNLVTDAGRGAYVYLDEPSEAAEVFGTRFHEVMSVAARNVQIQVDLPSYLQIENFYGEEYSTEKADIEPQNLAPGDSMILSQTLEATTAGAVCGNDVIRVSVTWETPISHEQRHTAPLVRSLSSLLAVPPSSQMQKATAVIAYAQALETGDPLDLEKARATVESAYAASDPKDPDLEAIGELLSQHPALQ